MKTLSPEAVAQYRRDGFYFPLRVLSPEEAVEGERGGPLGGELRHKGHLLFTWLDELIRHPRVLDAVEDILGPNLLCWSSSFFIKEARDPAFVSWHQDSTEPDVVTAWVAFSESSSTGVPPRRGSASGAASRGSVLRRRWASRARRGG